MICFKVIQEQVIFPRRATGHLAVVFFRVSFGPNHMYVFHHPQDLAKKMKSGETIETPTFDTAQKEIAKSSGLMGPADGKSKGTAFI